MHLSFTLKIALSKFSLTEKEDFQHLCLAFSSLLSCTKHSITVLRSSKTVDYVH